MIFSRKHKFVYMAPAKTGTTSICSILTQYFEADVWRFDSSERYWPKHDSHLPEELSDYFIFATVRNPFRHSVSLYCNKCFIKNEPTHIEGFFEFISSSDRTLVKMLNQHKEYNPPIGCTRFTINRFLDTDRDLDQQFNSLPFIKKQYKLPHLKKSINESLYYTEEMAEIVRQKRKEDFDFFNYSTEIPTDLRCL